MLDQQVDDASSSVPDWVRQARPGSVPKSSMSAVGAQSTIGKTLLIKGEITGSESVHIEGKVEGSIALPDDRVTVGRNGRVSANIAAQDIVVLGEVLDHCVLDDFVFQCGDPERTFPSVAFLDVDPSRWKRPIRTAMQPTVQIGKPTLQPGFILLPCHPIHARCSLAFRRTEAVP